MKNSLIIGFITISVLIFSENLFISQSQSSTNLSWEQWKLNYGFTFNGDINGYREILYMTNIAKIA